MSHYYTNANNPGEVVELDERSARLDNLDNWTHHTSREDAEKATSGGGGYVVEQGVLRRKGMVAAPTIAPRRDDAVPAPATTAPKVTAKAAAERADAEKPATRR